MWGTNGSRPEHDAKTEALLAELRAGNTDLARLVEHVRRHRQKSVVISTAALVAWEKREPDSWAKVQEWLAARGVAILRV